jgi:hypothetical protein
MNCSKEFLFILSLSFAHENINIAIADKEMSRKKEIQELLKDTQNEIFSLSKRLNSWETYFLYFQLH